MKKILAAFTAICLSGATVAFAQSQLDALRYGQTDLHGTARSLAMAGAFGALGGDISVMGNNPAGLGVYRSSEWVITLVQTTPKTTATWGNSTTTNKDRAKLSIDNFACVGSFNTAREEGIVGWTAGFSYNKVKDFRRTYTMTGEGQAIPASISDYIAEHSRYGMDELDDPDNAYLNDVSWLSTLGYQAGLIDYFNDEEHPRSAFGSFGQDEGYSPYPMSKASLTVQEQGAVDHYNLAAAINISNYLFAGISMAITNMDYTYSSKYDEKFNNDDDLFLDNTLITKGSGFSLNVGLIARPADFLRIGLAYRSPVWYTMTDYFDSQAGSSVTIVNEVGENEYRELPPAATPKGAFSKYLYRSPDKWLFSTAAIFGQSALLSVDYELTNFGKMALFDFYTSQENRPVNDEIKANMDQTATLRIGGEYKLTPQLALRAGWSYSQSAVSAVLGKGSTRGEAVIAGTIPHFTIDKGTTAYSLGAGYRFSSNFYSDIACVLSSSKEEAYAFPDLLILDNTDHSIHAPLNTQRLRIALTFGYKF
ncbi:MAG: outer membrane protein transport protein [Tannerellaceae bacterium]|jgi:long-subunit fatty acid transport protein|nr:outer membrane protein transport protein [Tannerellaceae bacterium]